MGIISDFFLRVSIVGISEFVKNISETVKIFFECVEIAKRMKNESARSSIKVEDNGHAFMSSSRSFTIPVCRRRGDRNYFPNVNKPHLIVSAKTQDILGISRGPHFSEYCAIETVNVENSETETMLSNFASDSIVLVDLRQEKKTITVQFYILNIVPSCDDICYVIQFSMHNCELDDSSAAYLKLIFDVVIEQTLEVFYKFREPLRGDNYDRLELELRVLNRLGYDPEFEETKKGYACSFVIPSLNSEAMEMMGSSSALVDTILPFSFPQSLPIVKLLSPNGKTKEIDLKDAWNANYTLGHIIRALQEE